MTRQLLSVPTREVVGTLDVPLNWEKTVPHVKLSCGHTEPVGTESMSERQCWSCWREARQELLAERRARRRARR